MIYGIEIENFFKLIAVEAFNVLFCFQCRQKQDELPATLIRFLEILSVRFEFNNQVDKLALLLNGDKWDLKRLQKPSQIASLDFHELIRRN